MKNPLVFGNAPRMKVDTTDNTGNLMHAVAGRKILGLHSNQNLARPLSHDELLFAKENHSCVVYIASNIVRPIRRESTLQLHSIIADNLKRLGLPVVTLGVGSQASLDEASADVQVSSETLELLLTLSRLSCNIGCRGEFTVDALKRFGVNNAIPLGCPSVYYHLKKFKHESRVKQLQHSLSQAKKVLFNYTSFRREYPVLGLGRSLTSYKLVGQMEYYEEAIAKGREYLRSRSYAEIFESGLVREKEFSEFIARNFVKFSDLEEWMRYASDFDFCFGSRFHGNMVSLQAGVPAVWFVHDQRTKELCEYHKLPFVKTGSGLLKIADISQVYEACDYNGFFEEYEKNRLRLKCYLAASGIEDALGSLEL
jgi:hypothetical protein